MPSHCGTPGNDVVDTLAKHALNLLPPEQPITFEHAVAEIKRKSAILVLDVHKRKAKGNAWEIIQGNKIPPTLPTSARAANSFLTTIYSDT